MIRQTRAPSGNRLIAVCPRADIRSPTPVGNGILIPILQPVHEFKVVTAGYSNDVANSGFLQPAEQKMVIDCVVRMPPSGALRGIEVCTV